MRISGIPRQLVSCALSLVQCAWRLSADTAQLTAFTNIARPHTRDQRGRLAD
jgi:hypothetical protein